MNHLDTKFEGFSDYDDFGLIAHDQSNILQWKARSLAGKSVLIKTLGFPSEADNELLAEEFRLLTILKLRYSQL
jgi:hypothetical protein